MRLANGIIIDKEKTFGVLKFSALRREVHIQNEDGTVSEEIKERTYDLKCKEQGRMIQVSIRVYDEKLCEAIKKLSERRRNVVLMFYFLELPDAEIAEILDISRNSVYRNRMCSLKLIRDMYEEEL